MHSVWTWTKSSIHQIQKKSVQIFSITYLILVRIHFRNIQNQRNEIAWVTFSIQVEIYQDHLEVRILTFHSFCSARIWYHLFCSHDSHVSHLIFLALEEFFLLWYICSLHIVSIYAEIGRRSQPSIQHMCIKLQQITRILWNMMKNSETSTVYEYMQMTTRFCLFVCLFSFWAVCSYFFSISHMSAWERKFNFEFVLAKTNLQCDTSKDVTLANNVVISWKRCFVFDIFILEIRSSKYYIYTIQKSLFLAQALICCLFH